MRKILIFFAMAIYFSLCSCDGFKPKDPKDNKITIHDDKIIAILSNEDIQLQHEFATLTKEYEDKLYGDWIVKDNFIGYNLKYDISGGHLDAGFINIHKNRYDEIYTIYKDPHTKSYRSPIFIYYTETLDEMSKDNLLYYSGIENLSTDTIGVVILGFGITENSTDNYELLPSKFILIDNYVIAVRTYTFYELERADFKK